MRKITLVLLFASFVGFSGCSTIEAIKGSPPGATNERAGAIITALETDLHTIAPIASAIHPLGGVAVEGLLAIVGIGGALFGGKQRRNAQRATAKAVDVQAALATIILAVEKFKDPELKESIFKASMTTGTSQTIHTAVSQLPPSTG
jgi:uncharacterized protein YceK